MAKNNNDLEGCLTSIGSTVISVGMLIYMVWTIPFVINNVYYNSIISMFPQAPHLSFWNFLEIHFFINSFLIFKGIKKLVLQYENDENKVEDILFKRRTKMVILQLAAPWIFLAIYHITLYFIK